LLVANKTNDLFFVKASNYHAFKANNADPIAVLKNWHQRLGHPNVQAVKRLLRPGRIDGMNAITCNYLQTFESKACVLKIRKQLATASSAPPATRADDLLDLVHVYIWGPATSMGGKGFFLTCYNYYWHHINLYFMANKPDAF
jgi:hypothetical protein